MRRNAGSWTVTDGGRLLTFPSRSQQRQYVKSHPGAHPTKTEYQRRLEIGAAKGKSRTAAAGHHPPTFVTKSTYKAQQVSTVAIRDRKTGEYDVSARRLKELDTLYTARTGIKPAAIVLGMRFTSKSAGSLDMWGYRYQLRPHQPLDFGDQRGVTQSDWIAINLSRRTFDKYISQGMGAKEIFERFYGTKMPQDATILQVTYQESHSMAQKRTMLANQAHRRLEQQQGSRAGRNR